MQSLLFILLILSVAGCSRAEKAPVGNIRTDPSARTVEPLPPQKDSVAEAIIRDSASVPAARLITPGRGIGSIYLNEAADSVHAGLGKSDDGDAAMGHAWETWYSKAAGDLRQQLNIYTVRDSAEKMRVRHIRITSPFFRTGKGISTASSLEAILHAYPDARQLREENSIRVYDDVQQGIAFEIRTDTKICRAITVHPAGKKATDEYMPLDRP